MRFVLGFVRELSCIYACFLIQGLNDEVNPKAAELEESNALALAIIQPGKINLFLLSYHISIIYP